MQRRPVRPLRAPEAPLGLSGQGSAGFGAQGALACLGEAAVMLARLGLASCAALRPLAEQAVVVRAAAASARTQGGQQPGGGQGEAGGAGASGPDLPTTEQVLEAAWARAPLLGQTACGAHVARTDPTSDPGSGMGAGELLGLLLEEEAGALVAAAAAGGVPAGRAACEAAAALGQLLDHTSDPLATLYAPGEPQQARRRARALVLRARCIGALRAAWPAPLLAEGYGLGLDSPWTGLLEPADQAAVKDLAEAADLLETCAGADGAARLSAGAAAEARAGGCSVTGNLESAAARAELALAIAAATRRRTLTSGRDSEPPAGPTSAGCCDGRSPGAATAMDCSPARCGSSVKVCAASQDADGSAVDADAAWVAAAEQAGRAVAHWEAALAAAASGSPSAATAERAPDGGRSDAGGAVPPVHTDAPGASWLDDGGEAAGGSPAASPAAAAQAAAELAMMLGLQGRDEAAAHAADAADGLSCLHSQDAGQSRAACAPPGGVPADGVSLVGAARGRALLDTIICPYPGPCLEGCASQGHDAEAVWLRAEAATAAEDARRGGAAALLRRAALHRAAAEAARRAGAPGCSVHAHSSGANWGCLHVLGKACPLTGVAILT